MSLVSFDSVRKHQKIKGFLIFSGVLKETSGMKWVNANLKISIYIRVHIYPKNFTFSSSLQNVCYKHTITIEYVKK